MSRRRLWGAPAALALALAAAGCGVPTGGAPTTVAPSDVPYGLASPTDTAPAPVTPAPTTDEPAVFLVGDGDVLVPRGRESGPGTTADRLTELLGALAAGPTAGERREGLSTALPLGVELGVAGIRAGTATVDLRAPADAPSARESRAAVAQIVLSATSVPGVQAVLLTSSGSPVEAPLPSGELTSAPLTSADYAAFLTSVPD